VPEITVREEVRRELIENIENISGIVWQRAHKVSVKLQDSSNAS